MFKKITTYLTLLLIFTMVSGCASGPSSYFRNNNYYIEERIKVAIMPFTNLSTTKDADEKVTYSLIMHLLNTGYFDVIDSGQVRQGMSKLKLRKDEGLSRENIEKLSEEIEADVLMMGAVEEYKIDSSTMLGEKIFVPEVAVSMRMISCQDGAIVWAANHNRRGNDRMTVFGMGRIDSISELTDIIVKDTITSLMHTMNTEYDSVELLKKNSNQKARIEREQAIDSALEKVFVQDNKTEVKTEIIERDVVRSPTQEKIEPQKLNADVTSPAATLSSQTNKKDAANAPSKPDKEPVPVKEMYQEQYDKIKQQYAK